MHTANCSLTLPEVLVCLVEDSKYTLATYSIHTYRTSHSNLVAPSTSSDLQALNAWDVPHLLHSQRMTAVSSSMIEYRALSL